MHSIVLCHSQYCIVLLIYCYVDITQYNDMHKFVGVLDNPPFTDLSKWRTLRPTLDKAAATTASVKPLYYKQQNKHK